MRIVHVITRMIVGGAQENTLLNCLDLKRLYGDDVTLITGPSLGPEGDLLQQGRGGDLRVIRVPELQRPIHPVRDVVALRAVTRHLRDLQPDVVHTHSAKGGIIGRQAAARLAIPAVIHTVHGAPVYEAQARLMRSLSTWLERRAARQADHIISVADAMTEAIVRFGITTPERCTTIYSGMDVDRFLAANDRRAEVRERFGLRPEHVVFGKIARLFHLKGHDDVITAAARVCRDAPNVRFLLVGDGILRQALLDRIESMQLGDRFIFTGLLPPEQIPELIGAMDVLVHTSYREGLARALPQALIAGKPVISYDVDGAREVTIDDATGFLVPPGATGTLAERILLLASDAELRGRLGGEGQRRFTELFRHETMTHRVREVYQHVLSEKGASAQ